MMSFQHKVWSEKEDIQRPQIKNRYLYKMSSKNIKEKVA